MMSILIKILKHNEINSDNNNFKVFNQINLQIFENTIYKRLKNYLKFKISLYKLIV
jgi:hypothetical protein